MKYPGMSEFDATRLASALFEQHTAGGELHQRASVEGIDRLVLNSTATFHEGGNGEKWFTLVVSLGFMDGFQAYVSSLHNVVNDVLIIRPGLYEVSAMDDTSDIRRLTKQGYPADAVYERLVPRQIEPLRKPITEALQLLERLEVGLKRILES